MKCPYCQGSSHVVDTREVSAAIRRRRECNVCDQRFTTYERVAATNLQVVKSDGRREDFNRDKLVSSMQLACAKRPVSFDTLESIATDIESKMYRMGRTEVPSEVIGEMVMAHLKNLDDVAYVRFASVYRRFADLEVLADEIDQLRVSKELAEQRKRQLSMEL
jgi:transcriptional repressor NrdR